MKLVLAEYLKTLREKDELDLLICDMLLLDGYVIDYRPRSGERQYGVDVLARKDDDVFLFVIKQKDITRATWDSGPDSIRQSLNDILDVYLSSMLPSEYLSKSIHIIVATNGYMQTAVQPNWKGFQDTHQYYKEHKLFYNLWSLDELVHLSSRVAFNETLFDSSMQSVLRKTLYYLDEPNYSSRSYEKIVLSYIEKVKAESVKRKRDNLLISFFTCMSLIEHWACDLKKYKIAIDVMVYSILQYWKFISEEKLFEDQKAISILLKFLEHYASSSNQFVKELSSVASVKHAFVNYNPISNRLLICDILSRLGEYGYYLMYFGQTEKAKIIVNILTSILNNNTYAYCPVFDNNAIDYSIIVTLFRLVCPENVASFLQNLIQGIIAQYQTDKYIPSPRDSFEEALNSFFEKHSPTYDASILLGYLLEWTCQEDLPDDFNRINSFITTIGANTTCQTWQAKPDEEINLFSANYAHFSGSAITFSDHSDFQKFRDTITLLQKNNHFNDFLFNQYSFSPVAVFASRYFHNPLPPEFWWKTAL